MIKKIVEILFLKKLKNYDRENEGGALGEINEKLC